MKFYPILFASALALQPFALMAKNGDLETIDATREGDESQDDETIRRQEYEVVVEDSVTYLPSLNTVAARFPAPIHQTPASVEVVTAPLFESQNATVLSEALNYVGGIVSHTGFGVFDFFTIRGFDSLSGGLILTDGIPEPEVSFFHLYNLERIEVLKGPGAFLYGGSALAGSVNLVRKQPVAENLLQLNGSVGSFQTFRGGLDLNRVSADGRLAFRLNLFGQDSSGYRDDSDSRQWAINPAVSWALGRQSHLSANFEFVRNEYQPDAGIPLVGDRVADVPRTRSYQSPFDFSDQKLYRFRVHYDAVLSDSVTLRNRFYTTNMDWRTDGTLLAGAFPNQQGRVDVHRFLTVLGDSQTLIGNRFEGLFSFQTGSVSHSLLAGIEVTRQTDDFSLEVAFLPPIDLLEPAETASRPLFIIPGQSQIGDARTWNVAPYFINQIGIGPQVQLFAGGRFDIARFDEELLATSRDDDRFSPLVGLVYSPAPDVSLYANYGEAFAPPSVRVVGDREPEESRQAEVGVKKQFYNGRIQSTLAVYHLERDQIAIPDSFGIPRQTGNQRSRGLEVSLAGEPTSGWYALTSYAFTNAKLTEFRELVVNPFDPASAAIIDRSGNRPAFAPRHLFKFWTLRDLPNGWSAGGGGRFVGRQFIAEDNSFGIDSYLILDAVVSCRHTDWRWSVNFENVTDRKYLSRGFGPASVLPARPFGLWGKIEFLL